jgi:hypothetical protein
VSTGVGVDIATVVDIPNASVESIKREYIDMKRKKNALCVRWGKHLIKMTNKIYVLKEGIYV